MSRIPRFQEHLKTGFTAEAVSAARFRAFAERSRQDGFHNLAERWLRLAAAKDRLAIDLLVAAEQVRGSDADLGSAIAEERYENDVLYPKMKRDVDAETGAAFEKVVTAQQRQIQELESLRREHTASHGDVHLPDEVDQGSPQAPSR